MKKIFFWLYLHKFLIMWNDLTQAEKATIIKLGVKAGYTSVEDIQKVYDEHNSFSDGGSFEEWREQLVDVKPHMAEDIYSEDPTYDYLKYFEENPEDAWNMLVMDSKAHFTDKYKLPNHPTFSDQSIYSTPETPGGTWHENYGGSGRWVFEHSPYTIKHKEATHRYLEGSGEGYLDGMNAIFPQETIRTNKHGFGDWLHSIFSDEEAEAVELTPFTFNNTTMYRNDNDNTYYADDKGRVPVKDTDNDLLYAYYNSNIKGMSNEDIINFYTKRYRSLQDKWMAASKPLEYNTRSPKIKVTKGKSSDVLVPTAMIDSIVSHMKDHKYTVNKQSGLVDDPYTALAVASVETDFGKHLNHGSLVEKSGLTPAVFNDERYYLPDQSYYAGLSTALRNYYNELSKTQKMEDKQENFVKHYLVLKNLFNDPKAVEYVGNALKKDLVYKRFKNYTFKDLETPPNVYDHILEKIFSGKYNSGRPDYNDIVIKNAATLRKDPNISKYVKQATKKYNK